MLGRMPYHTRKKCGEFTLLLIYAWLCSQIHPCHAVTCRISTASFNNYTTVTQRKGYVDVNGVRILNIRGHVEEDSYAEGPLPGLWIVALTPACEVLDVSLFTPNESDDSRYRSFHFLNGTYLDEHIISLPRGTIIIGISGSQVEKLFQNAPRDCDNADDALMDVGMCKYRQNQYMMAALGLQFVYTEHVVGGFVAQKGHPQKARWMIAHALFSPLQLETSITTPDNLVCLPMQPILPFKRVLPVTDGFIIVQQFQCTGTVTAWRFYATNVGEIIFSILRKEGSRYVRTGLTHVMPDQMVQGENVVCLFLVEHLKVHQGDLIGVHYPQGYTEKPVIPYMTIHDINKQVWPNCKHANAFGLTEADLVPLQFYSTSTMANNTFSYNAIHKWTADLFNIYTFKGEAENSQTSQLGVMSVHPIMASDHTYHCSCMTDSECRRGDLFTVCQWGKCVCQDDFTFDPVRNQCILDLLNVDSAMYLSHAARDEEEAAVGEDCTRVGGSDMPWMVIDLGEVREVYGVSFTHDTLENNVTSYTVPGPSTPSLESAYKLDRWYWYLENLNVTVAGYEHPPCIKNIQTSLSRAVVRGITENTVSFTLMNDRTWTTSPSLSFQVYEPALFNFRVSVSSTGDAANFNPAAFESCTHYNGNIMSGEHVNIACDEVMRGRYVMIHIPGDGYVGTPQSYTGRHPQHLWFSLCRVHVHGTAVVTPLDHQREAPSPSTSTPRPLDDDERTVLADQGSQMEGGCDATLNICSDICTIMSGGGFRCSCLPGMDLAYDGVNCVVKSRYVLRLILRAMEYSEDYNNLLHPRTQDLIKVINKEIFGHYIFTVIQIEMSTITLMNNGFGGMVIGLFLIHNFDTYTFTRLVQEIDISIAGMKLKVGDGETEYYVERGSTIMYEGSDGKDVLIWYPYYRCRDQDLCGQHKSCVIRNTEQHCRCKVYLFWTISCDDDAESSALSVIHETAQLGKERDDEGLQGYEIILIFLAFLVFAILFAIIFSCGIRRRNRKKAPQENDVQLRSVKY